MNSAKELAQAIDEFRVKKKWTTSKTLNHFGISAATLGRWRASRSGPTWVHFQRVKKILAEDTLPMTSSTETATDICMGVVDATTDRSKKKKRTKPVSGAQSENAQT